MGNEFSHLVGNELIKEALLQMVARGKIGNSLLFAGMDGVGKGLFALALAKALLCADDPKGSHRHKIESGQHPDIHIYKPEGKTGMHSIAAMREFSAAVYTHPNEAKYKVFILHDAERMLPYSSNALLKTFEEPPPFSIIILLSSAPEALLPTILSRCRTIYFAPVAQETISKLLQDKCQLDHSQAQRVASWAKGSIGRAYALAQQKDAKHDLKQDIRQLLLGLLARGSVQTYKEFTQALEKVTGRLEKCRKEVEENVRHELIGDLGKALTASQRECLEKEVEGSAALFYMHEVNRLLEMIVSWYRDLHLIRANGDTTHLIYGDMKENLIRLAQSDIELLPMDRILKIASEAKVAIERSSNLSSTLENLFLET